MQQKLNFLTLGVRDLAAMKAFYENVFGWHPLKEQEGIAFYKLNGFIFGLYPEKDLAEDIGITETGTGFRRMTMAINFSSAAKVDEVYTKLIAGGSKAIKQPEQVFWGGYRGYLADIEDNYWEIAWNPFLEMDEMGNVLSHQ